jgi:hypothetical protein
MLNMVQPRWTMVMAHMVPMRLLILVPTSILFVVLLNTSMHTGKNNFHNLGCIFLKEPCMLDSIVPLGESSLHLERNLTQSIIQNITQVVWPIKATINYGISNGLIMIINASSENEMKSIFVAASQHRATSSQWNINGALDGYMGELFAEIMDEVHNVEDAQNVVLDAITKCNCSSNLGEISIIPSLKFLQNHEI